jgi:hypothetical protein
MQGQAMREAVRTISRFRCSACGWRGAGGTWWVHRGAGR